METALAYCYKHLLQYIKMVTQCMNLFLYDSLSLNLTQILMLSAGVTYLFLFILLHRVYMVGYFINFKKLII